MELSNVKVLSFDCYGTLIDWETGLLNILSPWLNNEDINNSDEEILDLFSNIEPEVQTKSPQLNYMNVLETVITKMGERFGIKADDGLIASFGNSVGAWPPFSDSLEALKTLQKHFKLVILSNIDNKSIKQSIGNHLQVDFYRVFTAEDIGSYKPDLNNFHYMVKHLNDLGIEAENILHVAQSLFHDHVPAKKLGLTTAWIDRGMSKGGSGATKHPGENIIPDYHFDSMEGFVKAINFV